MSDDSLHVEVDQELCMGMGYCFRAAPDMFAPTEDGIVRLTSETRPAGPLEVPESSRGAAIEAANLCPSLAIVLTETES